MKKIFTTLGCAIALVAFAMPASAQTEISFNTGGSVTLGGSNGTQVILKAVDGGVNGTEDHYLGIKTNSKTYVGNDIVLNINVSGGQSWGDKPLNPVEMTDGFLAYNTAESINTAKDFTFTYTGSEEIEFTFQIGVVDGTVYVPVDDINIVLGTPFVLSSTAKKAIFLDKNEEKSLDYRVYLATDSETDLFESQELTLTGDGSIIEWYPILGTNGKYAYNGVINQNTHYVFTYSGTEEIACTLAKGVYTPYGAPTFMESEAIVLDPADGNQYVLELAEMPFYFPDMTIAKVDLKMEDGDPIGTQIQVFRGSNNVENTDDAELINFYLGNYENGELTAAEGETGNTVVVDLTSYTVSEDEGYEGTPIAGVYKVVLPESAVVNTEDGAQNIEQSYTFTILPGLEATSQILRGSDGLVNGVKVTYPGTSMKESGNSVSCTVGTKPAAIVWDEESTSVTFNLEGMEEGEYELVIPATMYIITNASSDDSTSNPDAQGDTAIEGLYLNYEFKMNVNIAKPQEVEVNKEFTLETDSSLWVYTPTEDVENYYLTCENTNNIFDDDLVLVASDPEGNVWVMLTPEPTADGYVYTGTNLVADTPIYFIYKGDEYTAVTLTLHLEAYASTPIVALGETFEVSSTSKSYLYISNEEGEFYLSSNSMTNLLENGTLTISTFGTNIFSTEYEVEAIEVEGSLEYTNLTFQGDGASYSIEYTGSETIELSIHSGKSSGITSLKTDIEEGSVIYNLQGQKVANPAKGGIYFINGKKVVVK